MKNEVLSKRLKQIGIIEILLGGIVVFYIFGPGFYIDPYWGGFGFIIVIINFLLSIPFIILFFAGIFLAVLWSEGVALNYVALIWISLYGIIFAYISRGLSIGEILAMTGYIAFMYFFLKFLSSTKEKGILKE